MKERTQKLYKGSEKKKVAALYDLVSECRLLTRDTTRGCTCKKSFLEEVSKSLTPMYCKELQEKKIFCNLEISVANK